MSLLKAILLGVIQGLTEFIPVSSSAHLILVPWAFGWKNQALVSLWFDATILPDCHDNFVLSLADV
jgi:undecaprenyl-diphosphatase